MSGNNVQNSAICGLDSDPSLQYDASRPLVQGLDEASNVSLTVAATGGARPKTRNRQYLSSTAPIPGQPLNPNGINASDVSSPPNRLGFRKSNSKFNLLDRKLRQAKRDESEATKDISGPQGSLNRKDSVISIGSITSEGALMDESDPRNIKIVSREEEVIASPLGHSVKEQPYQELLDGLGPDGANARLTRKPISHKQGCEQTRGIAERSKYMNRMNHHHEIMTKRFNKNLTELNKKKERGETITREEVEQLLERYPSEPRLSAKIKRYYLGDEDGIDGAKRGARSSIEELDEPPDERTPLITHTILPNHPPTHVLPASVYQIHLPYLPSSTSEHSQVNSIVTIAAIWNTMMGTSLLTMPWAFSQSGLALGPIVALIMTFIALATALMINQLYRILVARMGALAITEFHSICAHLLDRSLTIIGQIASIAAVFGASIVYYILLSGFLTDVYQHIVHIGQHNDTTPTVDGDYLKFMNLTLDEVDVKNASKGLICMGHHDKHNHNESHAVPTLYLQDSISGGWFPIIFGASGDSGGGSSILENIVTPHTAPLFMLLVYPLLCFKDVTYFTKLNSLGTINVFFIIGSILYKATEWGINVDIFDSSAREYTPLFNPNVYALSGTLAMGLFIHNALITILKNNRHQENNARDVTIAFSLVGFCYLFIGMVFYISFPLSKTCIADNFLNNFPTDGTLAFALRLALMCQLITVYPLLCYIIRALFLSMVGWADMKYRYTLVFNMAICVVGIWFAEYYPNVGTVVRWAGAICGMCIIFILPCACYCTFRTRENKRSVWIEAFCYTVSILGILNFVSQFLTFIH